ncbi:Trimethyllysine dioxygenase, mitochondrial [Eumeta japonica]|uniref:Trimethyllysine dioxygenase, mitochondrial n=1 Tax=Eumeta variegata TaxID=151549 RepID=A0A4C1SP36_EUMVA|nr:Trimethyllysine dioxygenase, mitochondrial [Eumeta japonica]
MRREAKYRQCENKCGSVDAIATTNIIPFKRPGLGQRIRSVFRVDATLEGTEEVCKRLGGIQHTLFGGMWKFTSQAVHADTAYSTLPLAPHNDSTYFTEATGSRSAIHSRLFGTEQDSARGISPKTLSPKTVKVYPERVQLQVLHCLEHRDGSGGDTILVDGFYGAARLREQHPEYFRLLSTYELEAEYIEEGHHYRHAAPVISTNPATGDLKQIRFNIYDRAPMAFRSGEECRSYYSALKALAHFYQDPGNQFRFKLTPGLIVVMDNFRLLHGRTAFTGSRVLCGCYVSRSDWLDRARTLQLIA